MAIILLCVLRVHVHGVILVHVNDIHVYMPPKKIIPFGTFYILLSEPPPPPPPPPPTPEPMAIIIYITGPLITIIVMMHNIATSYHWSHEYS